MFICHGYLHKCRFGHGLSNLLVEGVFTSCFEARSLVLVAAGHLELLGGIVFEAIYVAARLRLLVQYLLGRSDYLSPGPEEVSIFVAILYVALSVLLHCEALLEFATNVLIIKGLDVIHAQSLRIIIGRRMRRGLGNACPLNELPRHHHRRMAFHAIL